MVHPVLANLSHNILLALPNNSTAHLFSPALDKMRAAVRDDSEVLRVVVRDDKCAFCAP
jgi:hypothetical protein